MAEISGTKKHIALFVPSLQGGGAERVMVMLANGFAAHGHRVDLVLAKADGPYLAEISPDVRVVDLQKSRVLFSLVPLVRYLRREKPTSMLSALIHANIVAILARRLSGSSSRLVVSERSSPSGSYGFFYRYVLHPLVRVLYPFADGIVAVSDGVRRELIDAFRISEGKVTAIPNPIDIGTISQLASRPIDHPWTQQGAPQLILAVGRLVPEKDYPSLLDAFRLVRNHTDAHLVILGEGPLRPVLEAKVRDDGLEDAVYMPGFDSNPFRWMVRCDAYVLASLTEGFPNSLVQAMACGAAVVSTDCPHGPNEILNDGKWGKLVPVGDSEAMAASIVTILRAEKDGLSRNGVEPFMADSVIGRYLDMLV